ncbi:lantibiotic ABC transporter permease [Opitutaceae bacterium TAV5]|nr:lantibiotic ABC transporter permease [Opitutaceae bacterium TAV5]
MSTDYAISIEHVRKSFGGVHALRDVSLHVRKGTIHALVGENGAGKSTLMKILAGIHTRDGGIIRIDGRDVDFRSPRDSQREAIGIVHQELALAPDLTVAENLYLDNLSRGSLSINWRKLNESAAAAIRAFGFDIDPKTPVSELGIAQRQIIEIAKILARDVRILILDEPSAVLADPEIDVLFASLRRLREQGVSIIYISHRLQEIFRIADEITVIKDGQTVTTLDPAACTEDDIITNMVGRKLSALFPPKTPPPPSAPGEHPLLEIKNLSRHRVLRDIHLRLRAGEIVGLAGLVGSGRTELARCLFGIDRADTGTIAKNGAPLRLPRSASHAMRSGIGLVPEDRKGQGGLLELPIATNATLASLRKVTRFGLINHRAENRQTQAARERLHMRLGSIHDPLSSLSGGNQQKVILGKWLDADCDLLILDEPTRGVDVGAKAEIFNLITELSARRLGVLMISSELVEIVGLCHRAYVMCEGTITGELAGDEITEEAIMRLALPKRAAA